MKGLALPIDPLEDRPETGAAPRVERCHVADSAEQVGTKIRMTLPVLRTRAPCGAVRENRLQSIDLIPWDIGSLVHDHAGEHLPIARVHHLRLAMIHFEPLFPRDRRDARAETR